MGRRERFLMSKVVDFAAPQIVMIPNWFDELEAKMAEQVQ